MKMKHKEYAQLTGFFAVMGGLFIIAPIAVYLTGGPIAWYAGLLVLMLILGILNHRLRFPRERHKYLDAVVLGFLTPIAAAGGPVRLIFTLVACFLGGVIITPWWQGILFGWLISGIGMLLYLLFLFFTQKRQEKAA